MTGGERSAIEAQGSVETPRGLKLPPLGKPMSISGLSPTLATSAATTAFRVGAELGLTAR
jgi:hypothetical protein